MGVMCGGGAEDLKGQLLLPVCVNERWSKTLSVRLCQWMLLSSSWHGLS
jgi:hypothetical protein